MLKNSEQSDYHRFFENLFIDLGLDHYANVNINNQVFRSFYGNAIRQTEVGKVLSKSSLSIYKNCRVAILI